MSHVWRLCAWRLHFVPRRRKALQFFHVWRLCAWCFAGQYATLCAWRLCARCFAGQDATHDATHEDSAFSPETGLLCCTRWAGVVFERFVAIAPAFRELWSVPT